MQDHIAIGAKMKKKNLLVVLLGTFSLALLGVAQGATVNIFENAGTVEYVDSITGYGTTGYDMTGMEVTVNYWNGGSQLVSWDADGAGTGANGTDWSLTMNDPALSTYYSSHWVFDTSGSALIESIVLNGFAHNVVFDNDETSFPGTPGSAWGNPLQTDYYATNTSYVGNIDVTYFGHVAITGSTAFGDLYQGMSISFESGAFEAGDTFTFYQDTDNIVNPVPEPATMLLFGVGVLGLVGRRFWKKKN